MTAARIILSLLPSKHDVTVTERGRIRPCAKRKRERNIRNADRDVLCSFAERLSVSNLSRRCVGVSVPFRRSDAPHFDAKQE